MTNTVFWLEVRVGNVRHEVGLVTGDPDNPDADTRDVVGHMVADWAESYRQEETDD